MSRAEEEAEPRLESSSSFPHEAQRNEISLFQRVPYVKDKAITTRCLDYGLKIRPSLDMTGNPNYYGGGSGSSIEPRFPSRRPTNFAVESGLIYTISNSLHIFDEYGMIHAAWQWLCSTSSPQTPRINPPLPVIRREQDAVSSEKRNGVTIGVELIFSPWSAAE